MNLQVRSNSRKSTRIQPSFVPVIKPQSVTMYKDGGDVIKNPKHGDTGWWKSQPVIYNSRWGNTEWLTVIDYRKKKATATGEPDFRLRRIVDGPCRVHTPKPTPEWLMRSVFQRS